MSMRYEQVRYRYLKVKIIIIIHSTLITDEIEKASTDVITKRKLDQCYLYGCLQLQIISIPILQFAKIQNI